MLMPADTIDIGLLMRFEQGLVPEDPGKSSVPARILGYGEISTIFEIMEPSMQGLALKRLPIFKTDDELAAYENLFYEYHRILAEDMGIRVPRHASARVDFGQDSKVIYCIQEKMTEGCMCHQLLQRLDHESVMRLFRAVLNEMKKVWDYNASQGRIEVALDAQLSNWSLLTGKPPEHLNDGDIELVYIDTSTPLVRLDGIEQLDTDLFLRSAPSFLVWLIKLFFLKDVVSRYYDPRLAVVDLIANLFKEQRADLVRPFIKEANSFFERELEAIGKKHITFEEVRAYYREDALIWSLYVWLRKIDRFLCLKVLKKPYRYILPGKIRR